VNNGYTLLDSGDGRKLEQVGSFRLVRPAPLALWSSSEPAAEWDRADGVFQAGASGGRGGWVEPVRFPESWIINHAGLPFLIKPNESGSIGFFPEHARLWGTVEGTIRNIPFKKKPKLLNVFACTGGATMAAAGAGAEVCHLDGARSSVSRARENLALAGLVDRPVRWIVDDARKFCAREKRRHVKYDAVVLDPPSFGRGSRGGTWKIERDLAGFLELVSDILSDVAFLVLLSCHSPGFTPLLLESLLIGFKETRGGGIVSGELSLPGGALQRNLPAGSYAAWTLTEPVTDRE